MHKIKLYIYLDLSSVSLQASCGIYPLLRFREERMTTFRGEDLSLQEKGLPNSTKLKS